MPAVERELARLGWRADPASPVQLIGGGGARSLGAGAYTSLDCAREQRAAALRCKRLLGGDAIATLTLLFIDRASASPLHTVNASRRESFADIADIADIADALASEALKLDPRGVVAGAATAC